MTSEKILFVLDFDHAVIDDNSDLYCKRLAPGGKIPQEIEETYSDLCWTHYMGLIFDYLHKQFVTVKNNTETAWTKFRWQMACENSMSK